MKRLLTGLWLGLTWLAAHAQVDSVIDFNLLVSQGFNQTEVFHHPRRQEALVLNMKDFALRSYYWVDSVGDPPPVHVFDDRYKLGDWRYYFAHEVDLQGRYHVYYFDANDKVLRSRVFDPATGDFEVHKNLFTLARNEVPIGMVGPTPQGLVLATMQKKTSRVNIYRFTPGQEADREHWRYDLSDQTFDESAWGSLYSAILTMDLSKGKYNIKAHGVSALIGAHQSVGQANTRMKLYVEDEKLIFTSDVDEGYSLVITFPLQANKQASVHRLSPSCEPCTKGNPFPPSSAVVQEHLIQVQGSPRALGFTVYDLTDFAVVHEEIYYKDSSEVFENTAQQESISLGYTFTQLRFSYFEASSPEQVARKFFRAMRQGPPLLSAVPQGQDGIALRMIGLWENRALIIGSAIMMGALAGGLAAMVAEDRVITVDLNLDAQSWRARSTPTLPSQELSVFLQEVDTGLFDTILNYFHCGPHLWILYRPRLKAPGHEYRLQRITVDWP